MGANTAMTKARKMLLKKKGRYGFTKRKTLLNNEKLNIFFGDASLIILVKGRKYPFRLWSNIENS